MHALFRRHEVFAAAPHISHVDQPLNDGRARCRCAQRAILHLLADFFVRNLPPCVLHIQQDARVAVFLRRLGLVARHLRALAEPLVPDGQRRKPLLVVIRLLFSFALVSAVDGLPSFLRDGFPRAEKIILAAGRDHAQRVVFVIRIERRRQSLGDHLVQPALIRSQIHAIRALARRDDRVVIGQLRVVKHALGHPNAIGKRLLADGLQRAVIAAQRRLHLAEHIVRQIAAVRPRIGQQLVLFVELLRCRQRLFRGKAQLRVRFALERR